MREVDVKVEEIYYGAYELGKNGSNDSIKRAPLFDLKTFLDIIEWSQAAASFKRYGHSDEIFDLKSRSEHLNGTLSRLSNWLHRLTHEMETSRGRFRRQAGQRNENTSFWYSVKSYFHARKQLPEHANKDIWNAIIAMMDQKMAMFEGIQDDEPVEQGLAAVKWAIQNQNAQQGYTALEETVKTFLCREFDMDYANKNLRELTKGICLDYYKGKNVQAVLQRVNDNKVPVNDKDVERLKQVYQYNEKQQGFSKLVFKIKERRNAINHFGYVTTDQFSFLDLEGELKQLYVDFLGYVYRSRNMDIPENLLV